jgi:hypothetical protein
MNDKLTTIGLAVFLGIALVLLAKIAWTNHQLENARNTLTSQLQTADLELGRARTELGNVKAELATLDKDLQNSIKKNKEQAIAYSKLRAEYDVLAAKKPATVIVERGIPVECPAGKFALGQIYRATSDTKLDPLFLITGTAEDFRMKMSCEVNGEPTASKEIPVNLSYALHMNFSGMFLQTRLPDGGFNHYFKLYEINKAGKVVGEIKLTEFKTVMEDLTMDHFMWWNPHVDIAAYLLVNKNPLREPLLGASLGLSLAGYGITDNDLQARFARFSFDLGNTVGIGFEPVSYNLGELIPLISNLWLGPHVTYDFSKGWFGGFTLGAML